MSKRIKVGVIILILYSIIISAYFVYFIEHYSGAVVTCVDLLKEIKDKRDFEYEMQMKLIRKLQKDSQLCAIKLKKLCREQSCSKSLLCKEISTISTQ